MTALRRCGYCGDAFDSSRKEATFCSRECAQKIQQTRQHWPLPYVRTHLYEALCINCGVPRDAGNLTDDQAQTVARAGLARCTNCGGWMILEQVPYQPRSSGSDPRTPAVIDTRARTPVPTGRRTG